MRPGGSTLNRRWRMERERESEGYSLSVLVAAIVHRKAESRLTRTATRTVDDWAGAGQGHPLRQAGTRKQERSCQPAQSGYARKLAPLRPAFVGETPPMTNDAAPAANDAAIAANDAAIAAPDAAIAANDSSSAAPDAPSAPMTLLKDGVDT